MAKSKSFQPYDYTLYLSASEMQDHQQLLLLGSTLSQLFQETDSFKDGLASAIGHKEASLTYLEALEQIIRFIQNGREHAQLWDQLAARLQPVYERTIKKNQIS